MTWRALILTGPKTLTFEVSDARAPAPNEVLIRTLFSGISAGTELTQYRATSPFMSRSFDEKMRLFLTSETPSWSWPVRNLGYEEVGVIEAIGTAVTELQIGQKIYGTWGHRTYHIAQEDWAAQRVLPANADPRIGIFSHIGAVAINGVHDAAIRLGDEVAVFGLGVVGQIVVQAAKAAGARVIGIDPVASRRKLALDLGLDEAVDPLVGSVAEALKARTKGRGVDVCIEASGNDQALAEAIRTCAYSGKVVAMGFYQGDVTGLRLGEEFHHNRVQLISSQISGVAPEASYRWSKPRLWATAIDLQDRGLLNLIPLISHKFAFDDAPTAFAQLDAGASDLMQAVLEFEAMS